MIFADFKQKSPSKQHFFTLFRGTDQPGLKEKLTATFISFMPPLAFLAIVIAIQPINHLYFYVFAIVIAFFLDKYCV